MADPFAQLRAGLEPAEPDAGFAARLRARIERALSLPKGVTVSMATVPAAPVLSPYLAVADARAAIAWYADVLGAVARAEPIVDVSHPLAKVTHEAAVGTVDQDQLETLMAHGLSPEEAIDVIVTGILR